MKVTLLLLLGVVACGAPPAEVRAVKDQRYSMSLQKVATHQDRYHFQICRLADSSVERRCFNPFIVDGEKAMEFEGTPDLKYLHIEGASKKTARYAAQTVVTVGIGALILFFVPKSVRRCFVGLFEMGKGSSKQVGKGSSKQIAKDTPKQLDEAFEQEIREDRIVAIAKGQKYSEEMIDKERKKYRPFDSKWIKILTSWFIVEGAFEAVDMLYELYKYLNQGLAKGQWGDGELELVKVYPQLLSDASGEATVKDLSRLAETLRRHLGLAFSDAYLMEFVGTTN